MNTPEEPVQKLIRLKRYEQPRAGYFEDFLQEFHQRQRRELLQRSSISLFFERVGTWIREVGTVKWVVGATTAYATLMFGILLWPGEPGNTPDPNIAPALHETTTPSMVPPVIKPPVTEDPVLEF